MRDSDATQPAYVPQRSLDKATLTERVYLSLREDILSNRLPPDSPLQEATIAAALGVSRGPVREAMRQLDAEGLVRLVPRRGAVVSSLSREEFLDSYRVREALEVLAIRLATPRLTLNDLDELDRLHQEMADYASAENVEGFFTANTAFHALFINRSGNKKLQEICHPLINQMRRYRMSSMSLRGGLQRSCDEHREIIRAVKASAVEEAAQLLSEHIQVPQRMLESDDEMELVPYLPVEPGAQAKAQEQTK